VSDDPERLAFSLDLLAHAETAPRPLSVCEDGHLVVAGNTHWAVDRLSIDLKSLVCRLVDHGGAQ
jgi:hypothetical protein